MKFMPRFAVLLSFACAWCVSWADEPCAAHGSMQFVCGMANAEDLVRVGNTRWIVSSGMAGDDVPGRLHLIDSETNTQTILFPGDKPVMRPDTTLFGSCPGPIDTTNFSAHGLDIRASGDGIHRLYLTSHGAREAVEVFELDARGERPVATWVGCVPMPKTAMMNSVTILPDGGFIATEMYSAVEPNAFARVFAGEVSGRVHGWRPGRAPAVVPGTELSGPNGIALSADGRYLFVAVYGSREVRRYRRSGESWHEGVVQDGTLRVDFMPDNLRWSPDGALLSTGHRPAADNTCATPPCAGGWSVVAIDPNAMTSRVLVDYDDTAPFQNATVALRVDDALWIGTFRGDRVLRLAASSLSN